MIRETIVKNLCRVARAWLLAAAGLLCWPIAATYAAPDEIVVFTDEFEKKGEVGYALHLNYAARARKTPDYPREQAPHRIFRLMPEVVWGLSDKWNLGVHVPMSYNVNSHSATLDDLKVRMHYLDAIEHGGDSAFFYGASFEIAIYHKRISEPRYNGEIRAIAGVRQGDWRVTLNPIFHQALSKNPGGRGVEFELFSQAMHEFNDSLSLGVEHYSSFGRLSNLTHGSQSAQTSYLVAEFKTKKHLEIHLGAGHGWAECTDKRVFKALVGLPFWEAV